MDDGDRVEVLLHDRLRTRDLNLVRHIAARTAPDGTGEVIARMVASAQGQRIAILMTGPAGTPLDRMAQLTRDMAESIHPGAAP